ncbi:MAG TPA: hypothetical protein VGH90_01540 [Chthoniobacteraceae bacterium]
MSTIPSWNLQDRRALLALGGVFVLGIVCGAQFAVSEPSTSRNAPLARPQADTTGGTKVRGRAPDEEEASEFLTRVHVVLSTHRRSDRAQLVAAIADGLDAAQIQEALRRLEKMHFPDRADIAAQLYNRWGSLEPEAALRHAQGLHKLTEIRAAKSAIIAGWVEKDAAAAENWVLALPAGVQKDAATAALIGAVGPKAPQHALELARQTQTQNEALAEKIFARWVERDPGDAARNAMKIPIGAFRDRALQFIGQEWAESDPRTAAGWEYTHLESLHEPYRPNWMYTDSALETWLLRDPRAASAWIGETPDEAQRTTLVSMALYYAGGRTGQNQNGQANPTLDPSTVRSLAMMLPDGSQRDRALGECATRAAAESPNLALSWVREETDDHLKSIMLSGMTSSLQGDALHDALREIEQVNANGTEQVNLDGLRWLSKESCATIGPWAARQANNQAYVNAVGLAWARSDSDGARDWLASLPAQTKDAALQKIVDQDAGLAPGNTTFNIVSAFQNDAGWAAQISDPQTRESAYEKLAETWLNCDADSAKAWLDQAPISADGKARLLAEKQSSSKR